MPIFKEYVSTYNAKVYVIHWDTRKLKPYTPEQIEGVTYYKRSNFNKEEILGLTLQIKPDIIYISGWMDKAYLYVTKKLKKKGTPIVTAFDDIWKGSFRQRLGSLAFPIVYKKFFTHAWVAGPYQFEFAKKMGFKNREIIFNMLTADTSIFSDKSRQVKKSERQKAFIYVGNFREIKGTDILIKAFDLYTENHQGNWGLVCIGNGELEEKLRHNKKIKVFSFSSSSKIVELSKNANVFILPSRNDQWGVVVHEFACLGLPLLLSENVGARTEFFINGFNGFQFHEDCPRQLAKTMKKFEELDYSKLIEMGDNSRMLSKKINIKTSAANFVSIIVQ
jgi:glycosyltransferase involved in cell wall biosynthesis